MKKLSLPQNEIIKLYNSGIGCYGIAKKYNCSAPSINNLLKNSGVLTKKTPNDYRKFKLNENYFETIDNENKAYFLGLIYSDGCVYKTTLRISLQEDDEYVLYKFLEDIESECKLYEIKKRKKTHKNQKLMTVSNVKMIDDLKKLGVTTKKSLILKFPTNEQVPEKYLNHFIRGVFDGDGSVYNYERIINGNHYIENGISIISSNEFISELHNNIGFGHVYQTNYGKNSFLSIKDRNELKLFINYLYRGATIFLKRKYEKSKNILLHLENKKYFYSGEKIIQYDLDNQPIKIWNNLKEIKEQTDYNTQTILRNIRGKIKTSNNFKFKIYDK